MNSGEFAPLRISGNKRYFVDAHDRPFFWLGDTQWQLFRNFSADDVEFILKDRADKGFSVIQVMVTGTGDGTIPNLDGNKPWLNDNPLTPGEAYFEKVDAVVRMAKQYGLILAMFLCHNNQKNYVRVDNARSYARWVANRYKNEPHLMWVFTTETPIQDNLPLIRELAAGIREATGDTHLISYKPDPVAPALSSGEIHTEPWLDFNMIQTWNYYEGIYGWVTRDYWRTPTKPVVMAEGVYEGGSTYRFVVTPRLIRKQAYWSYLAGGFHSYGHTYNFRLPKDWKTGLDAPGAHQMKILKDIFTARKWWDLVPDQRIFVSQTEEGTTLNTVARSTNGDWIMAYLHSPTTVVVDTRWVTEGYQTSGHQTDACWIDPSTGETRPIGRLHSNKTPFFTTPTDWIDAVLWIEKAG